MRTPHPSPFTQNRQTAMLPLPYQENAPCQKRPNLAMNTPR